jgi:hypothetical protein
MTTTYPTDLQQRLQEDPSGAARADVLKRLSALRFDCETAKRQLRDRDSFRQLQAATSAVAAAMRIVETLPPGPKVAN